MTFIFVVLFVVSIAVSIFLFARLKDEIKLIRGGGLAEEVKKEIESLILEFNKVSNRKIVLMDDKIRDLEKVVKTANEKIKELEKITKTAVDLIKRYELLKNSSKIPVSVSGVNESRALNTSEISSKFDTKILSLDSTDQKGENNANLLKKSDSALEKVKEKFPSKEEIENLDSAERINILKSLIKKGFDNQKLISMGFLESEIDIVKVIVSRE